MEIIKEIDGEYEIKITFEDLMILHYALCDLLERIDTNTSIEKKAAQELRDILEVLF